MPRRRSADPTRGIRITLPKSILDAIDNKLSYDASRSAWIAKACHDRLNNSGHSLSEFTTARLLSEVRWRDDITGEMKGIIEYWLDAHFS